MSVENAQKRIKQIKSIIESLKEIEGIETESIEITGFEKHRRNATGRYVVRMEHMAEIQQLVKKHREQIEAELEPLEQLMGAADLMFKNAGGGNVSPSN